MKRKKYNTNIRSMITKRKSIQIDVYADCAIIRKTKKELMPPKRAIPQVHSRRRLHICQVPGRSKLLRSDSVTKASAFELEAGSSDVAIMPLAAQSRYTALLTK